MAIGSLRHYVVYGSRISGQINRALAAHIRNKYTNSKLYIYVRLSLQKIKSISFSSRWQLYLLGSMDLLFKFRELVVIMITWNIASRSASFIKKCIVEDAAVIYKCGYILLCDYCCHVPEEWFFWWIDWRMFVWSTRSITTCGLILVCSIIHIYIRAHVTDHRWWGNLYAGDFYIIAKIGKYAWCI